MPYRVLKMRGSECWLFFVGGDVARAAWLATLWDTAPDVEPAQPTVVEDGVVFERVSVDLDDPWPHATRVVGTAPTSDGVIVTLESIAARDQPGGLKGALLVHASKSPRADAVWQDHPEVLTGSPAPKSDGPALDDDAESKAALEVLKKGAGHALVLEAWQNLFFRKVEGDATKRVSDALKAAASTGCRFNPRCLTLPLTNSPMQGAIVVRDGRAFRLDAIVVVPLPISTSRESSPAPMGNDELAMAFQTEGTSVGMLRAVTSVAVGEKHLFVASDDRSVYLVEREGAYSSVTMLGFKREEKSSIEARFEDVDGDGINDVLLFARWSKAGADSYDMHTQAAVVFRKADIAYTPHFDTFGRGVDVIGATDLSDVSRRAHAPVTVAMVSSAEACGVLAKVSTQAGLVASSTTSARLVMFDEPESPPYAVRVVPVAHATADDVAQLKDACAPVEGNSFSCRDGLCGHLGYGLGNFYRFVREGGTIKLETALIYVGS